MSTFGTFTLIKNEGRWIRPHLFSWLPFVDEMVFFDGNSTDGTLETIKEIRGSHPAGHKIKLYENKDCIDLDFSYQYLSNECLRSLSTDFALFAHPDMMLDDPGNMSNLGDAIAYTSEMRSFAGEPDGQLFEIKGGRNTVWKNIYRLRNPDLGLHYFGAYGSSNEDCYFSKITGKEHAMHLKPLRPGEHVHEIDFDAYPYDIKSSGMKISHFSDVRPLSRRIDRMMKCVLNQDKTLEEAKKITSVHPRVTFKDGYGFKFEPCDYPGYFKETANV